MCKKNDVFAALFVMFLTIGMVTFMSSSESAEGQLCQDRMTSSVGLEPKPDLIVSSVSWAPASSGEGDRLAFSVVVENMGGVGAGGFAAAYYVDRVRLGDWSFTGLSGGASSTVMFYWEAVGVGEHSVKVIADVYNDVAEEDEWDNEFVKSFSVGPRLKPDLAIYNMSWTPANPTEGDLIAFRFTVKTPVYGGHFTVAYYVDGSIVGRHRVTVSVDTIKFFWKAVGVGEHSVKVIADVYHDVAEEDETNNVLELGFSVHANASSATLVLTQRPTSKDAIQLQSKRNSYGANTEGWSTENSIELSYDDDSAEGWLGPGSSSPLHSHVWAVHFSSPLEPTQLLKVMFYLNGTINGQNALGHPCKLHIIDLNKSELFLLEVTPHYSGWFTVDLEPYFIVVPQHFLVGIEVFHSLQETEGDYVYVPALGYDINEPDGKSWWVFKGEEILWIPFETYNVMIRAVVGPAFNSPDLNGDGEVDILDVAIVSMAFGTKSEESDYNRAADLAEPYGEINIVDIATVARDCGKTSESR